jgi:hypothetical protein
MFTAPRMADGSIRAAACSTTVREWLDAEGTPSRPARATFAIALLFALTAVLPASAQQWACKNGKCERMMYGSSPSLSRVKINAHGPVTLEAGTSRELTYAIRLTVNARNEAEARRLVGSYAVRVDPQAGWTVVTAPGGAVMTNVLVKTPRLTSASIVTSDGGVTASGVDGLLDVDTGAGEVSIDRVTGNCKLTTGAGDIKVGQVGGALQCATGAGRIVVAKVGRESVLRTNGGDIVAHQMGGAVHAETGGGGVHIESAGGTVTAISGGGEIVVEKAAGVVTLRNMAGPVNVGSAAGVRCDSGSGGVRLANITGPIRVATSMGNISASLLGSHIADSFIATGNGDITILIPSNVGVRIQAQNSMADTIRRIVSDYAVIQPRRQGTRIVAEGSVNGGGPLLQISGTGGTIFIKKQ